MTPWTTTIISSLIAAVFAGVISGIFIHRLQRKMDRRQEKADRKEDAREIALTTYNTLMLKGLIASLSLGEATAEAVETQKYNGKQTAARDYAENVKHEIQNFMYSQGIDNLK